MFLNANKHLAVSATKFALGRKPPSSLSSTAALHAPASALKINNGVRMMTSFVRPLTAAPIANLPRAFGAPAARSAPTVSGARLASPVVPFDGENGGFVTHRRSMVVLHNGGLDERVTAPDEHFVPPAANQMCAAPMGTLKLADGTEIEGISFGAETSVAAEVVFNTGMVGYPESLTDPSYRGQILVLTYPLIGNYGVPSRSELDEFGLPKFFESDKIQVAGVIVSDYSHDYQHYQGMNSLSEWLKEHNVPALYNVDTRALTRKIRSEGSLLGTLSFNDENLHFEDVNKRNLVSEVSCKEPKTYGSGSKKIIAVDYGMKNNLIRSLARSGDVHIKVVPWDYDFNQEEYDGLFLSNGPGNPETIDVAVEHVRKAINAENPKPVFGICMGNQVLARAAGAKTNKMTFGNRGMNQPVIDLRTTRCYITPQNHGYEVDAKSLPNDWQPLFVNANDNSNEGIIHKSKPFFSVQFHPEARGGPTDTNFLFDMFLSQVRGEPQPVTTVALPQKPEAKKVLLLGSGGLSIGQAGEFDYSGSQAIKALKEENMEVVLLNPNIATVQSSADMAHKTYFEPVTPDFAEKLIEKERPDSIMLQFGGQTALNCGLELAKRGVLDKYGVQVLGTSIDTIEASEDRQMFADKLAEINEPAAISKTTNSVEGALDVAEEIGYPVLVRSAFSLGGLGSGFAVDAGELKTIVSKALSASPQVIIDKSFRGWKEVEYEIVRDSMDNCVAITNMENFDPLGIHTGDSIVVAPSQTLTNDEYFKLRQVSIDVVRHLGVIGECNVQFALNPESDEYFIIEVNPRLSRSSALASKATGYPLAYVAAKLALGKHLPEIKNSVTKNTTACFEPSLDYCVVKMPRWDNRKFATGVNHLGSAMKSVGEVMGIGRKYEEAFQKALRMVEDSVDGFGDFPPHFQPQDYSDPAKLDAALKQPNDQRVFAIAHAMHTGYTIDQIHNLTKIDKWFLYKLRNILKSESILKSHKLLDIPRSALMQAKQLGFSDEQIGRCSGTSEQDVRERRKELQVTPFVKQIDTLGAEYPAQTNYLYCTYNATEHDLDFNEHGTMVLGCGSYRIGSSVEFDWSAVSALRTLRSMGRKSIVLNYNPETVSTDYDESDRLYFDEISKERVLDVYELEQSSGVILSVGGQIPNNLAVPLSKNGVKVLGTQPDSIDNAEDRERFSAMLDRLGIDQPEWMALSSVEDAKKFAEKVGYPVLVRPSYVLSGAAMNVASSAEDLEAYLGQAEKLSTEHPVVVSKFILGAKEIEIDAVAQRGKLIAFAISEHVENAGVHSGDASLVLPAQKLYQETMKRVERTAARIAKELKITGPFNAQFLSKDNDIKVIECNLRASRSFPFVSKTYGKNFIELATKAMVLNGGEVLPTEHFSRDTDHVCIKAPMFSFTRLAGVDPILRCEMSSTGEVACFGADQYEAFLKSLISSGFRLPNKTRKILVRAGPTDSKVAFLESAHLLNSMGYKLYATPGTHKFFNEHGVSCDLVYAPDQPKSQPQATDMLRDGEFDLVISVPRDLSKTERSNGYFIRRTAVDYHVPLLTNIQAARLLTAALHRVDTDNWTVRSWSEYMKKSPDYAVQSA